MTTVCAAKTLARMAGALSARAMSNIYESERLLGEYLLFHYGSLAETLPADWALTSAAVLEFPRRCVEMLAGVDFPAGARALDVGCAVGRATFELARRCEAVVGIDFSQRFIDAGVELQRTGERSFVRVEEGERVVPGVARVPAEIARERVRFERGDAMDLRADLGSFEVVLAANLLCRLPEPARFLARLSELVRPGGTLVLTTPCTWLEEFTPRAHWLGHAGQTTLEGLRAHLEPHFALEETRELPFLLRETARKFQLTIAQGTRWRRL